MYRVAVVNSRSFGVHAPDLVERLKKYAEVEWISVDKKSHGKELAEKLKGFNFIIASVTPNYDREFFENNNDIILIARHGIGVDNVDIKAATENGVLVTRVPGEKERDSVAELAVSLALAAIRKVCFSANLVKKSLWKERGKILGFTIRGKTVGVIGLGNIGSRVSEIFSKGFNATVLAFDPYVSEEKAAEHGAKLVDLKTLLRESHIITLHTPLTNETYHMIGKKELELMRDGVVIVNTARGGLIDTNALIEYLEKGKIGAVALDVVEDEPIDGKHPILKYENVIVTPHIGANTSEGLRGMDEANVEAIISVIEKRIPPGLVNTEVIKRDNRAGIKQS